MNAGTYLFTYTIDNISGGGLFVGFTGFNGITRYTAGTYSEYVTLSSASTTIYIAPVSSGISFSVDKNYKQTILDEFTNQESDINPYYPSFKSHQLDLFRFSNYHPISKLDLITLLFGAS